MFYAILNENNIVIAVGKFENKFIEVDSQNEDLLNRYYNSENGNFEDNTN